MWPLNVTHPLPAPVSRAARHAYYASVSWLDFQVGRILDEVEALGMRENTVVVLHGDHGGRPGVVDGHHMIAAVLRHVDNIFHVHFADLCVRARLATGRA